MKKKTKRQRVDIREKVDHDTKLSSEDLILLLKIAGVLFVFYWLFRP